MQDAWKIPWSRKWQPSQKYSCLGNSMDTEAQWATVHGVAKSQIQLSNSITDTGMGWTTCPFSAQSKSSHVFPAERTMKHKDRLDFGLFPMKSNYCTRERRRQKEYPMTRKAHCGGDGYCLPHRLAIAPLSFQPVTLANNFSFL